MSSLNLLLRMMRSRSSCTLILVGVLLVVVITGADVKTTTSSGELYTAQVDLEILFRTQQPVIEAFEKYIAKEEMRLREIKRRLLPYIERGREKPSKVVGNPLTAFLLLKGLSVDLDFLKVIAESSVNSVELSNNMDALRKVYLFPSTEDLSGGAVALMRLQDTYQMETKRMAGGDLDGHCCTSELTADDCFEVGRQSYNTGDHDHTILWMREALRKSKEEQTNGSALAGGERFHTISQVDILEYLAFSTYEKGEIKNAIILTKELLALEPNHSRAYGNIEHYNRLLTDKRGEDGTITDKTLTIRERRVNKVGWEKAEYEALCRGEDQVLQLGLKCRYVNKGSPFLRIGPVKEELVNLKPKIYLYHDVLYDKEIEDIKRLAMPRFKRATVHNHVTGELVTAQYRISKSAWLQSGDHLAVDKVNKRVSEITGLDLSTAEELQVVNYGMAGQYEPHYDFARKDESDAFKTLGTGNRVATYLFYMSDVEAGGATVFPQLGLTLWPRKGTAVFWYNLLEDGNGDYSTRHAACPVLLGSKWVSNKWIHERGQEFRRPCKLHPSEEQTIPE